MPSLSRTQRCRRNAARSTLRLAATTKQRWRENCLRVAAAGLVAFAGSAPVAFGLWNEPLSLDIHDIPFVAELMPAMERLTKRLTGSWALVGERSGLDPHGIATEVLLSAPSGWMFQLEKLPGDLNNGLLLDQSQVGDTYTLSLNGLPVCGAFISAYRVEERGVVFANMPTDSSPNVVAESDWPSVEESAARAREYSDWPQMAQHTRDEEKEFAVYGQRRCYFSAAVGLVAAWDLDIRVAGLPYSVIVDEDTVYVAESRFFTASGVVRGYAKNSVDGATADFAVTDFTGDGTLTTSLFTTDTGNQTRASNSSHNFIYAAGAVEIAETTAFASAARMYDFFKNLGYAWTEKQPLTIKIHQTINGTVNNAIYVPGSSSSSGRPSINVGDGDGTALRSLPMDFDVVAHELSHQVIYTKIKSTDGESLVLHEGLADFFPFSFQGNDCLGESICPSGSSACVVPGRCLRSANNSLVYASGAYTTLPVHQQGQLVSGFLWDLREGDVGSDEEVTSLGFKTISYLQQTSDLKTFLLALHSADGASFANKFKCPIAKTACVRGLWKHYSTIGVDVGECSVDEAVCSKAVLTGSTTQASGAAGSSGKKKTRSGCGVIGGSAIAAADGTVPGGSVSGWLVLLLPVALVATGGRISHKRTFLG